MKILRVATSNDLQSHIPEELRAHRLIERALTEATGESVETILKAFWPDHRLLPALERWLERDQPDLVYIVVPTFTFGYESVPLRLERALGPVGRVVGGWGRKSADMPWLATNPVYRAGRQLLLATIGGATYFTTEEVIESVEQCLRLVLKHERAAPILRGPYSESVYDTRRSAKLRRERRRRHVHRALREICERLHVQYLGRDDAMDADLSGIGRDRLHRNQEGHRRTAAEETAVMLEAWSRIAAVRG